MSQKWGLENCKFGLWWSPPRGIMSKDHYFMTWGKAKLLEGFLFLSMNANWYLWRPALFSSLYACAFTQTHTHFSRLEAKSIVINIHENFIINVTEVILFLLSWDWYSHLESDQLWEKWQLWGSPAKATLHILLLKYKLLD